MSLTRLLREFEKTINQGINDHNYELARPPEEGKQGIEHPTMVKPKTCIGCLPHTNFNLYGAPNQFFQAPYVMIGLEDSNTINGECDTKILIQVCCYSSSAYIQDDKNELYNLDIPDNQSFQDVLLFLEFLRDIILQNDTIDGATIEEPIILGSYNSKELTYPYSFGYLSFSVNTHLAEKNHRKYNY